MMESQLSIEGIGQQKATLADWKKDSGLYTHFSSHMPKDIKWSAWTGEEHPWDEIEKHGDIYFGFGETEKEAIIDCCEKEEIALPFWW